MKNGTVINYRNGSIAWEGDWAAKDKLIVVTKPSRVLLFFEARDNASITLIANISAQGRKTVLPEVGQVRYVKRTGRTLQERLEEFQKTEGIHRHHLKLEPKSWIQQRSKATLNEAKVDEPSPQIRIKAGLPELPMELFLREGAAVVEISGDKYLVATGGTIIANESSVAEIMRCRIVSRARALKIASGFLHGIECESQTNYSRALVNSTLGSAQVKVTEEIRETLRLRSKGILRGMETIGSGKTPGDFVYHSLAFKLP